VIVSGKPAQASGPTVPTEAEPGTESELESETAEAKDTQAVDEPGDYERDEW
jgi:hypothetical protein